MTMSDHPDLAARTQRILLSNGWTQAAFYGGIALWQKGSANVVLMVSPVSTLRDVIRVMRSVDET